MGIMKRLKPTQERKLIRQYQRHHDDAAFREIAENMRDFVVALSRQFVLQWPHVDYDEAVSAAYRGVWLAVRDFRVQYRVRLATRAFTKIRTQHRMLLDMDRQFTRGGVLAVGIEESEDGDRNRDRGSNIRNTRGWRGDKHTENTRDKRAVQLKQKLRRAIHNELSPKQQSALLEAGLCSPLSGENRVLPPGSKWHLDKAVEKLKRVMQQQGDC